MSSIAVCILDTLRLDAFQEHFDWLPGREFSEAYSTAHWTNPSHASIFTGYYPSEVGVHAKSRSLDCPHETIAETLNSADYATRFWTANIHTYQWPGWDRGFNETIGPVSLEPTPDHVFDWSKAAQSIDDDRATKYFKALRKCVLSDASLAPSLLQGWHEFRKQQRNESGGSDILQRCRETEFGDDEFLVLNLMEAHTPYTAPDEYFEFDEPITAGTSDGFAGTVEEPDRVREAYHQCAAYLSDLYREIFDTLREDFDYIITLSDHGELLGEHGKWNHGYGVYPELTHVPLIVTGDGIDGTEDTPVSLLDVHRTIGDMASVDVDSRGQNLLESPSLKPRLTEYHGFLPGHQDEFRRKGVSKDVYERHDTHLSGVVIDAGYGYESVTDGFVGNSKLMDVLEELKAMVETRTVESEDGEIADEVREQLEDLGYA